MKIAIVLLLTAQLFGSEVKKEAIEATVREGVVTARAFELNHEDYEKKYESFTEGLDSMSTIESKKKIIAGELVRNYLKTKKSIEEKWALPVIDFEKPNVGVGGMLASSPITVVGKGFSNHYLALEPVLIEWKVANVENDSTVVLIGGTDHSDSLLVNGSFKINVANIRLRNYPTRNLFVGATVKIDTLVFHTGIEEHAGDRIMCFTVMPKQTHDTIVKRGKAEGKKLFEDNQEKIDRRILTKK
jgi:hypothetical protein